MTVNSKEQSGPVIYKYVLQRMPGTQVLELPVSLGPFRTQVLSTGIDPKRQLCIWAVVMPSEHVEEKRFFLAMTGGSPPDGEARFIGAVNDDGYMIHVWELQ